MKMEGNKQFDVKRFDKQMFWIKFKEIRYALIKMKFEMDFIVIGCGLPPYKLVLQYW